MKINENKERVSDTVCAGSQQNRREFLNGLGKWSMIVVAAVSFLRGAVFQVHAGSEGTARPEWEPPDPVSRRLAKKPHSDFKHTELAPGGPGYSEHHQHADAARTQPGAGQPSGPPPTKVLE
jgi:hypothetical protein